MNKSELSDALVQRSTLTKKEAADAVDSVFEIIQEEMAKGNQVQVTGFGAFKTNKRDARVGRNPKTGESVNIPEKNSPNFKAGKKLKEAVE